MWSDAVKPNVATSPRAYVWHWPRSGLGQAGFKPDRRARLILWFICLWKWWHSIESAVSVMLRSRHATAKALCHTLLLICVFSRLLTPPQPPSDGKWWHHCESMSATGPQALPGWYRKHTCVGQLQIQGRCMWTPSRLASAAAAVKACRPVSPLDHHRTPQPFLQEVPFPSTSLKSKYKHAVWVQEYLFVKLHLNIYICSDKCKSACIRI